MSSLPRETSHKLLEKVQMDFAMSLNNISEIDKTLLPLKKFQIGQSKAFNLDRDFKTERRRFSQIAHDHIIGSTQIPVTQSAELRRRSDIEAQRYLHSTKYLGGSAVYPKYTARERTDRITDFDDTFYRYKADFRRKLADQY